MKIKSKGVYHAAIPQGISGFPRPDAAGILSGMAYRRSGEHAPTRPLGQAAHGLEMILTNRPSSDPGRKQVGPHRLPVYTFSEAVEALHTDPFAVFLFWPVIPAH